MAPGIELCRFDPSTKIGVNCNICHVLVNVSAIKGDEGVMAQSRPRSHGQDDHGSNP